MKTVDEVIDGLRDRIGFGDPVLVDAIHYLEEYRSDKAIWEVTRNGYLDWIDQYKESREKYQQAVIELEKNPPLSWDELKQMVGKPVWVEFLKDGESYDAEWIIIQDINNWCMGDTQRFAYQKLDYSDKWQAYRKEK